MREYVRPIRSTGEGRAASLLLFRRRRGSLFYCRRYTPQIDLETVTAPVNGGSFEQLLGLLFRGSFSCECCPSNPFMASLGIAFRRHL